VRVTNLGRMTAAICGVIALAPINTAFAQTATSDNQAVLEKLIAAAKAEKTVMFYHSANTESLRLAMDAFEAKHGIKVENFFANSAPLSTRFSNEATGGKVVADTYYSSDTGIYDQFPKLFQKLTAENLPAYGRLPQAGKLENGLAVAHGQLSFAYMYNTDKIKEADAPRTWADLGNPKWKGETMVVNARNSATNMGGFNMARKEVPGLLERIAALDPRWVESANGMAQQLAAGTGSLGYVNYPSHALPLMEKKAPIKYRTLEGPEIARSAWLGATNGNHPNAGRLLVNFLLSDEGIGLYCKRSPGSKTMLDPTGKRTGCEPLSPSAKFLPDAPLPKTEAEAVIQQLKMP
jgi:iron(III) transport system substrate-binding protein